jgi:hypothetical protein
MAHSRVKVAQAQAGAMVSSAATCRDRGHVDEVAEGKIGVPVQPVVEAYTDRSKQALRQIKEGLSRQGRHPLEAATWD